MPGVKLFGASETKWPALESAIPGKFMPHEKCNHDSTRSEKLRRGEAMDFPGLYLHL